MTVGDCFATKAEPVVLLESHVGGPSYAFSGYCGEVVAFNPDDVCAAIETVERAAASGVHAAGFLTYEAASGLDRAYRVKTGHELPLVWFGLYKHRQNIVPQQFDTVTENFTLSAWFPSISRDVYDAVFRHIQQYIVSGDTYQVNYSFRLQALFEGDAWCFYRQLCQVQRTDFAAFIDLGHVQILSASPELFFSLKKGELTARPMKGTAPRGRWLEEDAEFMKALSQSEKDRAENVMIVDLLRNDLGRVSATGSVSVPVLCQIERYQTVFQMTSTVRGQLQEGTGFGQVMQALFPCGSITGTPKVRTMQIIDEIEVTPRGIYTGSIGYVSPGSEACFNVAIRTVCINRETQTATFGVGGGVTVDSTCDGEYHECLIKAALLTTQRTEFDLFETLRYDQADGFFLLDRHLNRLNQSALYWDFVFDPALAAKKLHDVIPDKQGFFRVRLLLKKEGICEVSTTPINNPQKDQVFRVCICDQPVDSANPFLFHKTTHREIYASRLALRPDCDDVILVNERGEVTECCIGNIVAKVAGVWLTPPVSCGLLAGTFRDLLLSQEIIQERILTVSDLHCAEGLYLINSVREWVQLILVD